MVLGGPAGLGIKKRWRERRSNGVHKTLCIVEMLALLCSLPSSRSKTHWQKLLLAKDAECCGSTCTKSYFVNGVHTHHRHGPLDLLSSMACKILVPNSCLPVVTRARQSLSRFRLHVEIDNVDRLHETLLLRGYLSASLLCATHSLTFNSSPL
jgi:hypothetical protein